ncbi:hypothetical protein GCM10009601_27320 [Streptomyces thermospinosisporus]|uniref:Uncharacterized protein n=1 Tax=Streptomyces thermospinosisporus TaxID=161482 RepID=A0ABN1YVL7_9ACTN
MTASAKDQQALSAECTLGRRPEYAAAHDMCRRTEDVPLPHSKGILLVESCTCRCHRARTQDAHPGGPGTRAATAAAPAGVGR